MAESYPLRPPLIVHHKAALDSVSFPPNSLERIAASVDAGAAIIEIDVLALSDGDYLLVHDAELERETTGAGVMANLTAAQARNLYIKDGGAATPYRVPLLSDVVNALQGSAAHLQIDFKNTLPFASDEPLERLARMVEPLGERVLVSSVADWQLRRLRALAPELALGFDVQLYLRWNDPDYAYPPQFPRQLGAYGYYDDHPLASRAILPAADYLADRCATLISLVPRVSAFYIDHRLLAQSLDDGFNWADALHANGIICDAWTLDVGSAPAEAHAKRLLEAGVDQFTSNTPLALGALLAG